MGIIAKDGFKFASLEQLPEWSAIKGLSFENLVVNNFRELLPSLGLEKTLVVSAAPFRKMSRSGASKGCGVQVDLMLQTRRSIYVVEVKRRNELGHEVVDEMEEKISRIRRPRGVSMKTALVYDGNLAKTVEADGYFDAVIDIRDIMF